MFTSQNLYFYTKSINPVCLKGIRCRDIYVPRGTVKKYGPLSSSALKKVQDAPATWSASERDCSSATWESFLPVIFSCLVGALNTVNYAWLQSSVFKLCHKYPSTCLLTPGVVMFLYVWHCMSGGGVGVRGASSSHRPHLHFWNIPACHSAHYTHRPHVFVLHHWSPNNVSDIAARPWKAH